MNKPHAKQGSITVFFLLFVLIAAGAISYSVYVGNIVGEKIKTHNAADAAAFSMAAHSAQGLNMISTNNLAIGASLHIAAASPIIGRYYALGRAFAVTVTDALDYAELMIDADETSFASGFKIMAPIAGHFVKTAAGLSSINETIANWWPIAAIPKGLEQMRAGRPGAIGLPMQASRPLGSTIDPTDLFRFRYDSLRRTKPGDTMCHAIKASEGQFQRDLSSAWLAGPLESLGAGDVVGSIMTAIQAVESVVQVAKDLLDAAVSVVLTPIKVLHASTCWVPLFKPPYCGDLKKGIEAFEALLSPPIPEFEACGLNDHGNYGEEQIPNFLDESNQTDSIGKLGFTYPHVTNEGERAAFENSNAFTMLVGMPLLKTSELPVDANGRPECPAAWTYEVDGQTYCEIMLGGVDAGNAKHTPGRSTGAGGVARATRVQGVVNPGRLANIWRRVQWSVGQARAVHRPDGTARRGLPGDPDHSYTGEMSPSEPAYLDRTRMQLFWPAWQAELTHVTIWSEILGFLGQ